MAMNKPKGILFDLGGTILGGLAFNPIAGNARLLQFAHEPGGLTAEEIQRAADRLERELPSRKEGLIELSVQSFQRLLYGELGLTFSLGPQELESEFWHASVQYTPEPGVSKVLELLELRIPTGIVSNSPFTGQTLLQELRSHGLADKVRFLLSSADYGIRKPHPWLFRIAARRLGLAPAEVWFVGDSLEFDVAGARRAGLPAVWYNPGKSPCDEPVPDLEIESWGEFLIIVQKH